MQNPTKHPLVVTILTAVHPWAGRSYVKRHYRKEMITQQMVGSRTIGVAEETICIYIYTCA